MFCKDENGEPVWPVLAFWPLCNELKGEEPVAFLLAPNPVKPKPAEPKPVDPNGVGAVVVGPLVEELKAGLICLPNAEEPNAGVPNALLLTPVPFNCVIGAAEPNWGFPKIDPEPIEDCVGRELPNVLVGVECEAAVAEKADVAEPTPKAGFPNKFAPVFWVAELVLLPKAGAPKADLPPFVLPPRPVLPNAGAALLLPKEDCPNAPEEPFRFVPKELPGPAGTAPPKAGFPEVNGLAPNVEVLLF